jgi:GNAT superfamily N-acetyltransferase
MLRIEPCSANDLEHLLAQDLPAHAVADHRERFALQAVGAATYLLAWRGDRHVGRATLYTESKYGEVRRLHPGLAEINGLDADPQGQGTGTALIAAAEDLVRK